MPCPHTVFNPDFLSDHTSAIKGPSIASIYFAASFSMYRTGGSLLSAAKGSPSLIFMRQFRTQGHGHSRPKGSSQEASYWLIAPPLTALHVAGSLAPSKFFFWCLQADFWFKTAQNSYPLGQTSPHHGDLPGGTVSWPTVARMYSNALTVSRRLIVQISNPNPCIFPTTSMNHVVGLKGPSIANISFAASFQCIVRGLENSVSLSHTGGGY